jgi:hypothetical protein
MEESLKTGFNEISSKMAINTASGALSKRNPLGTTS